jgi:hypothetical protein
MTKFDKEMLEILKKGKEHFGFLGIKAEFEAEGTRLDEMCMLTTVVRKAGLNLGVKIGGVEAFRDLYDAKKFSAEYIIAPMGETSYAISKYIDMKNKIYSKEEREGTKFLFNLETITGFENIQSIIETAKQENGSAGIVFGRVDFTLSKKLQRDAVSSDEVTEYCIKTAKECKKNNLELVVGGGVAIDSIPALNKIHAEYLTRFETRKIIFDAKIIATQSQLEKGIAHAVKFELLWLQHKQSYYSTIANEDSARIKMLSDRMGELSDYLK